MTGRKQEDKWTGWRVYKNNNISETSKQKQKGMVCKDSLGALSAISAVGTLESGDCGVGDKNFDDDGNDVWHAGEVKTVDDGVAVWRGVVGMVAI